MKTRLKKNCAKNVRCGQRTYAWNQRYFKTKVTAKGMRDGEGDRTNWKPISGKNWFLKFPDRKKNICTKVLFLATKDFRRRLNPLNLSDFSCVCIIFRSQYRNHAFSGATSWKKRILAACGFKIRTFLEKLKYLIHATFSLADVLNSY